MSCKGKGRTCKIAVNTALTGSLRVLLMVQIIWRRTLGHSPSMTQLITYFVAKLILACCMLAISTLLFISFACINKYLRKLQTKKEFVVFDNVHLGIVSDISPGRMQHEVVYATR